ncbi:MAG: sigma-70 family RNA polymerase sigma factor [Novosphingobium sp.]|nr:sigma-70 family RNA polymerase sigma factor [Novosphingobium sp.]
MAKAKKLTITLNRLEATKILKSYFLEINRKKYTPLDADEETRLFILYKERNNDKAKERIINSQQRFVVTVAKQYTKNNTFLMDLINEGNIGLMEAIDKFDYKLGYRFITYAVHYIQKNIRYHICKDSALVRQKSRIRTYAVLDKEKNRFYCENGRDPGADELATIINEKYNKNIKGIDTIPIYYYEIDGEEETRSNGIISSDNYEYNNSSNTHNDYNKTTEDDYFKITLNRLLDKLPERNRDILKKVYGVGCVPMMREKIAEEFNISRERVRQVINESLDKLKKISQNFTLY